VRTRRGLKRVAPPAVPARDCRDRPDGVVIEFVAELILVSSAVQRHGRVDAVASRWPKSRKVSLFSYIALKRTATFCSPLAGIQRHALVVPGADLSVAS